MKIKFSSREIAQILKSKQVLAEVERRGKLVLAAVDHDGYELVAGTGKSRGRVSVVARSQYARRSNAIHNTLVRSIDAGRG